MGLMATVVAVWVGMSAIPVAFMYACSKVSSRG